MTPIQKLESLILGGGDICIPDNEGDEWILIDVDENEYFGFTLEDAVSKLPDTAQTQFSEIEIGEEFLYLGQIWKKVSQNEVLNSEGRSWSLKFNQSVKRLK